MLSEKDYEKEVESAEGQELLALKIMMVSRNKKEIERVAYAIYDLARSKKMICKGPVSLKNSKLEITTRRSPCGNGSNTYDKYSMIVRKKSIEIATTYDTFKAITSTIVSSDVFMQVIIDRAR